VRKRTNWRDKLHPAFFELAELNRQFEVKWKRIEQECKQGLEALGPKAPAELRDKVVLRLKEKGDELDAELGEKLQEIDRRYGQLSYNPLAYSYLDPQPGQPDSDYFVPYLHWMRHRESLQTTVANDAKGDIKAFRKLARTGEDLRRIAHKKGRIKPFQGDVVHRQLLELVICYETARLTAEQLAECVDSYCACGETFHNSDALKRQRARLEEELKGSLSNQTASATPALRATAKKRK
jgi:hypothetical protein